MIDIDLETVIPLTEATKHYPGHPHVSTLWRQCTRANRYGITLETIVCGGKRMTSLEAIKRYFAANTAAANGTTVKPSTTKQRDRIANAERELDHFGV